MSRVPYTGELFEEDGQIVALCPELSVSSFGDSPTEAIAALQEAVSLFLQECRRMGTLTMVLEEAGYSRADRDSGDWQYRRPIQVDQLEAAVA